MGDVHMILMASFLRLPVFLTEDSDITLLKDIARRRLSLGSYDLCIYDVLDVVKKIAKCKECSLNHKELEAFVKQIGERENWKEVNNIWHATHDN